MKTTLNVLRTEICPRLEEKPLKYNYNNTPKIKHILTDYQEATGFKQTEHFLSKNTTN